MLFSGVTPEQVAEITMQVSREKYSGNVVPEWVKRYTAANVLNTDRTRFRGRIVVYDSNGPGAKRSASGRRGPNACWHVFRDVLQPIIMEYQCKVSTSMATYTPANWHGTYPQTARVNVGGMLNPRFPTELCKCVEPTPEVSVEELARLIERVHETNNRQQSPMQRLTTNYAPVYMDWEAEEAEQHKIEERIDQVLAQAIKVAEGECASCGAPTGSSAMVWCSQTCQEKFQAKMPGVTKIFRPPDEPLSSAVYE